MNIHDLESERAQTGRPHADPESATADERDHDTGRATDPGPGPAPATDRGQRRRRACAGPPAHAATTGHGGRGPAERPLTTRRERPHLWREPGAGRRRTSAWTRTTTSQSDDTPRRTIDEYNLDAGINRAMASAGVGIFAIREALQERDPVASWTRHFRESKDPTTDDDLAASDPRRLPRVHGGITSGCST